MATEQPCYTLITAPSDTEQPSEQQLKQDLERGDIRAKTEALKKCIHSILAGEKIPGILMTVIRFVLPLQDHTIKKLLLIFWEIVPKTLPDGKLMQEMILVCDAYRKDLQHPNEYIRGSTLRFLCKLKEPELLEPLMPAIQACLEHRHSYVRRNAVMAVCHANPSERSRFIRCIYNLLNSSSAAVRYEAAGTLVTLSSAPTAVRAAATAYIEIILKESDNNVKLIVLDRLVALKEHPSHERVLQELVMDILRILATPDLEVRKKTLELAMDLVTSRTVEELVLVLKKEVTKTHNTVEHEDVGKYRQLLVRTLHSCSIKFPDVSATVIPLLTEFLSDSNELAAADVLVFLREAVQRFDNLRPLVLEQLLEAYPIIGSVRVHRAATWILGEFATTADDVQSVLTQVRQALGELPLVEDERRRAAGQATDEEPSQQQQTVQKLVTADGTYATQSAFSAAPSAKKADAERPPLRKYLMSGDFFVASVLAATVAKLALRYCRLVTAPVKQHRLRAEAMLIIASMMHLGRSGLPDKAISDDDLERLQLCLRVVAEPNPLLEKIFLSACKDALNSMLKVKAETEAPRTAKERGVLAVQPDAPIAFLQLSGRNELAGSEDVFEASLSQAVGAVKRSAADFSSSKLSKVTQLTGFSDPVYAEAYVNVNQYDIVLDVLVVNQTSDTLQNCCLELATLGDLKLVEKPSPLVLGPKDFANIKANVKVSVNTTLTDLNEYLTHLMTSTNMRCLTPEKGLSGDSGFLAANLYARSIFGEDALANLSVEKPFNKPDAPVIGHIRIRAKSQGMALSLGDKISQVQKKARAAAAPAGA
ncbi:Coatomer subunit beta [Amphibalanus amphitrite]|uniref:Coatomer subunit beta n=1 Tax=Amphibalanus amphitrite TaxID=1232801 RepID=A0A6A4VYE3_AMPAM|nr:Coatomer subunit beta [Amphibalanus amphitrite]